MTAHFPNSSDVVPGVVVHTEQHGYYGAAFKRVFDIAFVLVASIVILPIVTILMCLIALDGSNPFYAQSRVGRHGRVFRMYKLRSMVKDADQKLVDFLASNEEARHEWGETQKLRNDPRVTRLGRFLRKTSLDELPQFFNVLRGEMSVVGPRPMMPSQRELYPGRAYYALKPGVTGMWQVGDRNSATFSSRASYDAQYYGCMGLKTDIVIILRTVRVMVVGTGQ